MLMHRDISKKSHIFQNQILSTRNGETICKLIKTLNYFSWFSCVVMYYLCVKTLKGYFNMKTLLCCGT